jgi:cell division control protein 6
MCRKRRITLRHVHLDLSTPRPCFRAINDLACLLNASKRYKKGISLEELMLRIEASLARYRGYLVLFVDEVDSVRRDKDTFLAFLIRRLPQRVPAKLILVFASNRLNWTENLDPRVQSFLKVNELVFKPYDAIDLQRILTIRVEKALCPGCVEPGVIEKIAALSSREHGDARQAVGLLAKSVYIAEKAGKRVSLDMVDRAADEIEQDKYVLMVRTAPPQLQIAFAAAVDASRRATENPLSTGQVYEAYRNFCDRASMKPLAGRAFSDLLAELDMYSLLRARIVSHGRAGRTREIEVDLPTDLIRRMYDTILINFELRPDPSTRLCSTSGPNA